PRRPHERGTAVLRVRVPLRQLRSYESVDDPGHGGAGQLLGCGELRDRPFAPEDEDREGGELSRGYAEGRVGGTGPSHQVDRHAVEPGGEIGERHHSHKVDSLPIIRAW